MLMPRPSCSKMALSWRPYLLKSPRDLETTRSDCQRAPTSWVTEMAGLIPCLGPGAQHTTLASPGPHRPALATAQALPGKIKACYVRVPTCPSGGHKPTTSSSEVQGPGQSILLSAVGGPDREDQV